MHNHLSSEDAPVKTGPAWSPCADEARVLFLHWGFSLRMANVFWFWSLLGIYIYICPLNCRTRNCLCKSELNFEKLINKLFKTNIYIKWSKLLKLFGKFLSEIFGWITKVYQCLRCEQNNSQNPLRSGQRSGCLKIEIIL